MRIIEIAPLPNGAHRNQSCNLPAAPAGWAVVPDDLVTHNYPFGDIAIEDGVVTAWNPLPMPEVEPDDKEPTQLDRIEAQVTYTAMMTDTLLEG